VIAHTRARMNSESRSVCLCAKYMFLEGRWSLCVSAEAERKVRRLSGSEKGSTRSREMLRDAKWDQVPVRLMEGVVA